MSENILKKKKIKNLEGKEQQITTNIKKQNVKMKIKYIQIEIKFEFYLIKEYKKSHVKSLVCKLLL